MGIVTSFGECYFTCVVMAGAFPCMFVEHVPEIASCFPEQKKKKNTILSVFISRVLGSKPHLYILAFFLCNFTLTFEEIFGHT